MPEREPNSDQQHPGIDQQQSPTVFRERSMKTASTLEEIYLAIQWKLDNHRASPDEVYRDASKRAAELVKEAIGSSELQQAVKDFDQSAQQYELVTLQTRANEKAITMINQRLEKQTGELTAIKGILQRISDRLQKIETDLR